VRDRLVAAFLLVLVACSGGQELVGLTWVLDPWSIAKLGIDVSAGTIVDLRFDGAQLEGSAACNTYGGPYEAGGGSLDIGEIVVTTRACEDPALMALESAYLEAFARVGGWKIGTADDGRPSLTLTGDGVELRYTAVEDALATAP
jgi:heat shock protein HslJ